ncbi:MAG: 4Fe-4S dicluster domain-containing protein [Oscillospiraceae bacterium]|nr:4Fe-4S dicluster domain-containing protein [Oscillospiraceae bacterium]
MPRVKLSVDIVGCKGCSLCVDACPKDILTLDKSFVNTKGYNPVKCQSQELCTGCAVCAIICPDSAIKVERV